MLAEPVIFWQAAGLAFAGGVHLAFLAGARLIAREWWPLAYPALLVGVSSVVALQGIVEMRWAALATLIGLACAAAADLVMHGLPRPKRPSLPDALAACAMAVNALWAAFPTYRYDQWNDHLIIAKVVAREGPLRGPVLNDHLFYTGSYEYLLTLGRALSGNDIFNECFADAFGWLLLCFGTWSAVTLARRILPSLPSALLITCFVVFALPEEEGILNAKPDGTLFVSSLAVEVAMVLMARSSVGGWASLVGFLFVAPLGMKTTWLLAMAALGGMAAAVVLREGVTDAFRPAVWIGAAAGTLSLLPYLFKNLRFFGNPIHPVQFGPFQSSFWGPGLAAYYHIVEGARSVERYTAQLATAPLTLLLFGLEMVALPFVVLALGLSVQLWQRTRPCLDAAGTLSIPAVIAFGIYLFLWPVAMPIGIYPRYYYVAFSFMVIIALELLAWAWPVISSKIAARLTLSALLLVPAAESALPTKAWRMMEASTLETRAFVASVAPMGPVLTRLELVNRDRRRRFPGAPFGRRVLLSDTSAGYFFDGANLVVGGREYLSHRSSQSSTCAWRLFDTLDIAYVASIEGPFRLWPPDIAALLPLLVPLDASGTALYVDPKLVHRMLEIDPSCGVQ
jgi:hypothetical protein